MTLKTEIIPATLEDYLTIQNMLQFYIYDLSRYASIDALSKKDINYFKTYLVEDSRKAFLIKIDNDLAGVCMINQAGFLSATQWNMGEFFIHAKFQGKGIGQQVVDQIWKKYPGRWEVPVIPENIPALTFWRKAISIFTDGQYLEQIKIIDYDKHQSQRIIITFDTSAKNATNIKSDISIRHSQVNDISSLVAMSYQKRRSYEKAQPQFWKYSGDSAELSQAKWFEELLAHNDHIMLTAESNQKIIGFIIGKLIPAPEVYNPGGLTLMIDDFCIENVADWSSTGCKLVQEIKVLSKKKGATQILIVCGAHDEPKRRFLKNIGLTVVSEWYVGGAI